MKKIYNTLLSGILIMGMIGCQSTQKDNSENLIPQPVSKMKKEGSFLLKDNINIVNSDQQLTPASNYLSSLLSKSTGFEIKQNAGNDTTILLSIEKLTDKNPGAYKVEVAPNRITIKANEYQGIIYGIQTIRQLLPYQIESDTIIPNFNWEIPAVTIADAPRYQWRGLMLDVSRHFYNKKEVKELLDLMALYKMNKFHWHLTDDQGWRIEIKKYPKLTENGGWRTFNNQDLGCIERAKSEHNPDMLLPKDKIRVENGDTLYGGFYTQEDIKEIVAYAKKRAIDVIPEIDMPGHFFSAISNYDGVSCFNSKERGQGFSSPICPGKNSALKFCENIYKEVFELFPYEYVHIGGDEVNKTNWKKCRDCQRRMRQNNLRTEEELQSWFIQHMERFFNENNKKLIGWDEIIEGGLSCSSTITWWRSWFPKAVPTATQHGNYAILCPNTQYYFDYKQDAKTLQKLYEDESMPKGLRPAQQRLIFGIQANVWTEWIPSRERMHYMVAPRILSLSENAWTVKEKRDWQTFKPRVLEQLPRLRAMNIAFRMFDVNGLLNQNCFVGSDMVEVSCEDPSLEIHYTDDGTYPTLESSLYKSSFKVQKSTNFIFAAFDKEGHHSDYAHSKYIKTDYALGKDVADKKEGIKVVWHEYRGNNCKGIEKAPVNKEYVVDKVSIPKGVEGNKGLVLTGYIEIPQKGIYTFKLISDDGSMLYINDREVVDNDGMHPTRMRSGQAALAKGLHPFKILFFDYNGGRLSMEIGDKKGKPINKTFKFYH